MTKSKAPTDSDANDDDADDDDDDDHNVRASMPSKNASKKMKKPKAPPKSNDFKELVVRKRMASLNASAMLAAAYEVERHLDRVESMAASDNDAPPKPTLPKKIKEIKDEVLESKDVNTLIHTLYTHTD